MLIPVVDRKDNIIGYKERSDVTSDDIYRVSALWVTNSKKEVLLAQRSFSKKNDPGKWGPAVAGTVEEDETYESNIYKEAEEEMGITGYTFELGPKIFTDKSKHPHFGQWYTLTINQPIDFFSIDKSEVKKIDFFTPSFLRDDFKNHPKKYFENTSFWLEPLLNWRSTESQKQE